MKHITYCVDKTDGVVYSRVGSEIAIPILQFDRIGESGDFTRPIVYELEKSDVLSLAYYWSNLKWTKKIPADIKNRHRVFWGFPLI